MQVCKAESHVLIQVYLNVGVSLHEFFHQTASVCAFEVACATLRSVCLCLWEFFFVWTCARLHCVLHRLCMCTVCVCASYICSSKASVCDSLDVSAASFIPSDIPASILWAQEQLATPVGHFHNKPIAIYEPDATHSLIQTRLYKKESTYSTQRHRHSPGYCWCNSCCVVVVLQHHQDLIVRVGYCCKCVTIALLSFSAADMRLYYGSGLTLGRSSGADFRSDVQIILPTRLWWMAKGESFRCTSHCLRVRQSHPDSSNEKMINKAYD